MCEVNLNGWTTAAAAAEANVTTATVPANVTTLAAVAQLATGSDNTATTPTAAAAASKLTINAAKGGGGTAAVAAASSYDCDDDDDDDDDVKAAIGLDEEATPFANCKAYKADDAIAGSKSARYHQPGMEAIGSGQHGSANQQLATRSRHKTQSRKRRRTNRRKKGKGAAQIGEGQHSFGNSNNGSSSSISSRINDGLHQLRSSEWAPSPVEIVNNSADAKIIDIHSSHPNHQEPMNLSQRQRLRHNHHHYPQPNHSEQHQQQQQVAATAAAAAWLRQLGPSVRSLLGPYQGIATQQTVATGELHLSSGGINSPHQQYLLPHLEATINNNNGPLSTPITMPPAYHQLYPKPPLRTNQSPATFLDSHRLLAAAAAAAASASNPTDNCYPSQTQTQTQTQSRQTVGEALQFASLHSLSAVASALHHHQQQSIFHQHLNQTTQYLIHHQTTQLPGQTRAKCQPVAKTTSASSSVAVAAAASSLLHHQQGATAAAGRRPRELRKCRRIYGIEQRGLWCTQCKWKKACSRFCDPLSRRNLRPNSSGRPPIHLAGRQPN